MSTKTIDTLFLEERRYPPPAEFAAQANAQPDIYERDPEEFWSTEGRERVTWFEDFDTVLEWELPYAKWFVGGKLNVTYNCVDRHVEAGNGDKVAYYWEGEPGDRRELTFADLQRETTKLANALKSLGVKKGTPVGIYLGMVPEAPIAMLACARIGAPHTFVFGGFSADSLSGRLQDMACEVVITQDEAWRRGTTVPLKKTTDEAVAASPTVHDVIVLRRTGGDVPMQEGRDHWWHELATDETECPSEPMDAEDLLYLLYTSGTTAKPKGIAHTTAGYLVGVATTHHYIFDIKPDSVYWCAADVGWVTGHSYIVYGPLSNGATSVMYEGAPDYPDKDVWWGIVERYGVTILYTAPTAIRACIKWGQEYPGAHDLSSLRLLGSVGEPINPKAWLWYHKVIGGERCPIVDTWWQTETGHILISPLPGVTETKPGSATRPLPGIEAAVVDDEGNEIDDPSTQGLLTLRRPWPGMLRTLYQEDDRFIETYYGKFGNTTYFVGDAARKDEDGYLWLLGRVDDVINVSGHRLSTAEIESAVVSYRKVAECAVIGQSDETTGQAICAFVTLEGDIEGNDEIAEIREHVAQRISKIARPSRIIWTGDLPKTRSGKIMRRLLRDIADGRELGDVTTLRDPAIMEQLEEKVKERQASDAGE